MSELRKDPVHERWVIVAAERARRPAAFHAEPPTPTAPPEDCPFCPGHESETLPEVAALRAPGSRPDAPGWRVRVVPNRYPALRPDAPGVPPGGSVPVGPTAAVPSPAIDWDADLAATAAPLRPCAATPPTAPVRLQRLQRLQCLPGYGRHEVIIEGPHTRSVPEIEPALYREVLEVYRERLADAARTPGLASATLIKNVGAAAGASIEHSHSQLIATPIVSPLLAAELRAAHPCPWCRAIAQDLADGDRLVYAGEHLVVLCPYAPRFPYESWILPRTHCPAFPEAPEALLDELAPLLQRLVGRMETVLPNPAYNIAWHTAPFARPGSPGTAGAERTATRGESDLHAHVDPRAYHWRVEILPRVTRVAGYEQASGIFINPVAPEQAATELRGL